MASPNKKLIAFHQLNDYSGSPKILSMTLNALLEDGYEIDLVTTKGGCLDSIQSPRLKKHYFPYRFSDNKVATLFRSSISQICMLYYGIRYGKGKQFLINTIMPTSGALAGKLLGQKVVYHYHENAFRKGLYYKIKAKLMLKLADSIICVSNYQKSFLPSNPHITVIPNALLNKHKEHLHPHTENGFESKKILLVSSLRSYKGVTLFAKLAQMMPDYNFALVANASESEIRNYFKSENIELPQNMEVYPQQKDVTPFYNNAGLLVNLSNKDYVIETFGLTVIEAMAAGVPVIVPDEGGVTEIVEDGKDGFVVDVRDAEIVKETIKKVFSDKGKYEELSRNALLSSNQHLEDKFKAEIIKLISGI